MLAWLKGLFNRKDMITAYAYPRPRGSWGVRRHENELCVFYGKHNAEKFAKEFANLLNAKGKKW